MKFEVRDEMIELSKENYAHVLPLLKNLAYEPVFAYSVIERNQSEKCSLITTKILPAVMTGVNR